jgi:NAD(P)H dehydrogenase (quinone)
MIYVPFGYGHTNIFSLEEIHGGSPYGASTHAGPDGSRKPSKLELEIAFAQGKYSAETFGSFKAGKAAVAKSAAQ